MWICQSRAFLSIVAHRTKPDHLLVRARVDGHIQEVFGQDVEVYHKPGGDYAFRADLTREFVAVVIGTNVRNISYGNFKDSVKDNALHDAYSGFWSIMYRLQSHLLKPVRHAFVKPPHEVGSKSRVKRLDTQRGKD